VKTIVIDDVLEQVDIAFYEKEEIWQPKIDKKLKSKDGLKLDFTSIDFTSVDYLLSSVSDIQYEYKGVIESIFNNTFTNVNKSINDIANRTNLELANKTVEIIAKDKLAGEARATINSQILQEFKNNKITGFQYMNKNNKLINVSLDAYINGITQEALTKSGASAILKVCLANNYDLVKVTSHNDPSPMCKMYENKIFSISGKNTKYPPLSSIVFNGKYVLGGGIWHRYCRHSIVPYIEADNIDFVYL
jgi:hypothetical protein